MAVVSFPSSLLDFENDSTTAEGFSALRRQKNQDQLRLTSDCLRQTEKFRPAVLHMFDTDWLWDYKYDFLPPTKYK